MFLTGSALRAWRKRENLTQAQLARRMDIARETLVRWENSEELSELVQLRLNTIQKTVVRPLDVLERGFIEERDFGTPHKRILPEITTGADLREWREQRGLTQAMLASMLNVTKGSVSQWENRMIVPFKVKAQIYNMLQPKPAPEPDALDAALAKLT